MTEGRHQTTYCRTIASIWSAADNRLLRRKETNISFSFENAFFLPNAPFPNHTLCFAYAQDTGYKRRLRIHVFVFGILFWLVRSCILIQCASKSHFTMFLVVVFVSFPSSLTLSLSLSLSFACSGHVTQITFSLAVGRQTPPLCPKDRRPLQPELEGTRMMIFPTGDGGPISEAQKARSTFLT